MSVTHQEYRELISNIDKALSQFSGKPIEEGFDLEIYHELRRVRETLIRAQRDLRDNNISRDSKSPLEPA